MAEVGSLITRHLENVKVKIQERMSQSGRNASGRSSASLTVEADNTHGILWGGSQFLVMERGRAAGPVPKGFFEIIYDWAKAKGLASKVRPRFERQSQDSALRSFAGAVAYTIMKKGTKLYRDKGYNDIFTTAVNEELEVLSDELIAVQTDSVAEINNDLL